MRAGPMSRASPAARRRNNHDRNSCGWNRTPAPSGPPPQASVKNTPSPIIAHPKPEMVAPSICVQAWIA